MPLNFCKATGPLVIGAVDIPLRLSALGLRVISFLLAGACADSNRRMEFDTKLDGSIPLTGRQPKLDKIPAPDQILGGTGGSVAAQRQISSRPIGQNMGVWGFPSGFSAHFWASKSGPVGDKTAPRATAGPFGNPGVWGRVGPNNKHQGSGVEPSLAGQGAPLLVMSTSPPGYGTPSPAGAPPTGRPRSR